eukprot:10536522-Alexandrium_andersonii.AAC.1
MALWIRQPLLLAIPSGSHSTLPPPQRMTDSAAASSTTPATATFATAVARVRGMKRRISDVSVS